MLLNSDGREGLTELCAQSIRVGLIPRQTRLTLFSLLRWEILVQNHVSLALRTVGGGGLLAASHDKVMGRHDSDLTKRSLLQSR